jgi:hypothetical protein
MNSPFSPRLTKAVVLNGWTWVLIRDMVFPVSGVKGTGKGDQGRHHGTNHSRLLLIDRIDSLYLLHSFLAAAQQGSAFSF